jgi:hypothetical protein
LAVALRAVPAARVMAGTLRFARPTAEASIATASIVSD